MALTTFSGPVRSTAGFIVPIQYIKATDVVDGEVQITAGADVVILSAADGGPASETKLVLPLVQTTNGTVFTINNASPYLDGIRGSVLNYGAVAHVLIGANDGVQPQRVNGSLTGTVIPAGYVVQFGGNGNPDAPWAASNSVLSTAK